MRVLFILFVVLPILEIWVLIKVGSALGAWPTIVLLILTAVVGVALLKRQGIDTLRRAQSKMTIGSLPSEELVEGIFLAVGGALLLTPGFITDIVGFFCLVPGIRHVIIAWGAKQLRFRSHSFMYAASQNKNSPEDGVAQNNKRTIEGEYRRED